MSKYNQSEELATATDLEIANARIANLEMCVKGLGLIITNLQRRMPGGVMPLEMKQGDGKEPLLWEYAGKFVREFLDLEDYENDFFIEGDW